MDTIISDAYINIFYWFILSVSFVTRNKTCPECNFASAVKCPSWCFGGPTAIQICVIFYSNTFVCQSHQRAVNAFIRTTHWCKINLKCRLTPNADSSLALKGWNRYSEYHSSPRLQDSLFSPEAKGTPTNQSKRKIYNVFSRKMQKFCYLLLAFLPLSAAEVKTEHCGNGDFVSSCDQCPTDPNGVLSWHLCTNVNPTRLDCIWDDANKRCWSFAATRSSGT